MNNRYIMMLPYLRGGLINLTFNMRSWTRVETKERTWWLENGCNINLVHAGHD